MVWWAFGWPGFMGFQNWRMAPCPDPKALPAPKTPWIELRLGLAMLRQWFDGLSAGALSGFLGFQNWRMAPCPDPKALPAPKSSLDWAAAGFSHAAAMVWWDFGWPPVWFYGIKTDGWPPVPIPKPSPLDWAAASFSHAAAMVWWSFGWHPVWFYGISKLTDGPLSPSQSPPRAQELLGLSCGWL